jgi:tricarballylate dehydrogenase
VVDGSRPYDLIIAGGGNAALCAAITARQAGCRVLVVEHAPRAMRGGNSRHTRNLRVMHDEPFDVLTGTYTEEEYWSDLLRVTKGKTDERLARLTIQGSREALPFMAQCGVKFQPALSGTLSLGRTNAFFLGGGKALMNAYYAHAARIGIDVVYDTEMVALKMEADRVTQAEIISVGARRTLRCQAVIAASGGFQANLEWLVQAWGAAANNFLIRGTPYAKGTILRNLMAQGVATVGDPTQGHAVAIDARAPKFDGGIVTRLDCVPFGIVVNKNGERFYDEGEDVWPKRYAIWGRLVAQQPDQIAYAITDAKAQPLFMPSVFPAIVAPSVGELAAKLGLDPARVTKTVDDFNAAVRPGAFHSTSIEDGCRTEGLVPAKTHWARRIDMGPFFGYPLRPGITFTYLGVKVDHKAQVLMDDGRPVRNLWAAGEIMAGNILGEGYTAGVGMAIGTVFGRIAGREAARYVGR